ncbi:ABC transporter ATP-binding protein [Ruegeria sp. 2205SS24-7]|uniref:ABC transporter ATP-binding protein n=1 Tax=Ruegeria discodermiae TaxID=3064389 RepID=UPI002741BC5A|nr:ABC transporter ATP-binding protein [Ruegeria sp. 2205SS24-7]MDP5220967.1 ABC transporter ATP-binding protein [Ruegeria sp. 2205SS24-7]
MSYLDLSSVSKTYGGKVQAVKDLNLSINTGEIVALLGSSGCGKTSTLRMIAGFEDVTAGEIRVNGTAIHQLPPARRGVAMAFEGYSLYPPLTIRENIAFAMKAERLDAAQVETRVKDIARLVELEDVLDRYPSSVSGGQQQRASLARALVRKADLHLLDEPMGQLEPQLRALLRGRVKHFIQERGLTAILVTHDQTEANALADKIAVMEDGELQQFDTPTALKDNPANLFTGTFIGEPPMNVFPAGMRRENRQVIFGLGDGVSLAYDEARFSPDLRDRLEKNRDQIAIGVRPHAVRLSEDGLPAEVLVNQWLGDQTHIAASFAGGSIVSVIHDRAKVQAGERVGVSVAPEDLHIFDGSTGTAISHGGQLA